MVFLWSLFEALVWKKGGVFVFCLQLVISASLMPHFFFNAQPLVQLPFYIMNFIQVDGCTLQVLKHLEFSLKVRNMFSHVAKTLFVPKIQRDLALPNACLQRPLWVPAPTSFPRLLNHLIAPFILKPHWFKLPHLGALSLTSWETGFLEDKYAMVWYWGGHVNKSRSWEGCNPVC